VYVLIFFSLLIELVCFLLLVTSIGYNLARHILFQKSKIYFPLVSPNIFPIKWLKTERRVVYFCQNICTKQMHLEGSYNFSTCMELVARKRLSAIWSDFFESGEGISQETVKHLLWAHREMCLRQRKYVHFNLKAPLNYKRKI
jgi:hypothetical protein